MHYDCLHLFSSRFVFTLLFLPAWIVSEQHNLQKNSFINSVPFAFPLIGYTATILPDIGPNHYVLTNEPRLGVAEPFNGQPTGSVTFSILGSSEVKNLFSTETVKHGGFYFLRLRTTYGAEFNTKKRSVYSFSVQAVFRSQQVNNRPPIYLSNQTHITINVLNRNDNCPFFSRDTYEWTIYENATKFTEVGRVMATDADSGINRQIYYFIQPEHNVATFQIDPRSGAVFPTRSLAIRRNNATQVEHATYLSMFQGLKEYTFKVSARHRGNLSHVNCELVSHARVKVKIHSVRPIEPKIFVSLLTTMPQPGSAGTVYANIKVDSAAKTSSLKLVIVEPEAAALFELVQVGREPEWLLRLKCQFSNLSLSSKIELTLEVTDIEYAATECIPSRARYGLEISLLPRSLFQIRLPDEIHITVSEMAIVDSTLHIINPEIGFHVYNSSFLFTQTVRNDRLPISITKTGAVIVTNTIDLEQLGTDRLEFPFNVADGNNILLSSMADSKLVVHITDYNEHDPVISNSVVEHSIVESLAVGSEVLRIEAKDPDFSNTRLSFVLFDEDKLPFNFSLTKPGTLLLKTALDAEIMPAEFHVKIKVSDSGLPYPRSVIAIRVIRILDINEFSPVFVETSCEAQLAVSKNGDILSLPPTGLELSRFYAEDLDRDGGGSVEIRLASSTVTRSCFNIEKKTGILALNCSNIGSPGSIVTVFLEASDKTRLSEKPFQLTIKLIESTLGHSFVKTCQPSGIYAQVWEQKQKRIDYESVLTGMTSIDSFFVKRKQIPPPILSLPAEIRVPENLPLGTTVLKFSAKFSSSSDTDGTNRLIYGVQAIGARFASGGMMASPPYQAFVLEGNSTTDVAAGTEMSLQVGAPIDRETFSALDVVIHACVVAEVSPLLCASSRLSIDIEDLMDAPPEFTIGDKRTGSHVVSLPENELEGTAIGQVSVDDSDPTKKIRYYLVNFRDTFKIHRRTGRISLKKRLDRELLDSYLLIVKARDTTEPPEPSNSQLHALALAATPDWALNRTATTYFRVNVLDINDNTPEFIGRYDDIVLPSDLPQGALVTTLRARDADLGNNVLIQYSLFGPEADKACFDCDLITGVVRVSAECSGGGLRPGHTYSLTAWARDLGSPEARQVSTEFRVRILGLRVNVYPPKFDASEGLYFGRIREGAPVGSAVLRAEAYEGDDSSARLRVKAHDPEGWSVAYRIIGGSGLGRFGITNEGQIYSTTELDAESASFSGGFWLETCACEEEPTVDDGDSGVMATDGNVPRCAVAEVFVQIEDVNDNQPMPAAPEYRFRVTEGTQPGSIVATVTGVDGDATGTQLHHSIVSGDPAGYFTINPSTGQIATSDKPIDRETSFVDANKQLTDEVLLTIELTDSGASPKSTRVQATVQIDDVNDEAPRFLFTAQGDECSSLEGETECYHFYHRPGSPLGAAGGNEGALCVGRVFAVDLDAGSNGTVTYESSGGNEGGSPGNDFFSVDPVTGQVCSTFGAAEALPPSATESVIWVTARDNGFPPLTTEKPIPVVITILPADADVEAPAELSSAGSDEAIQFATHPPTELATSPRTPPGTVLYEVEIAPGNHRHPAAAAAAAARWTFSLTDVFTPSPFAIAPLSARKSVVYLRDRLNATRSGVLHEVNVVAFAGGRIISQRTNILVEPFPVNPPILDVSAVASGSQSTINITDYGSLQEESGASGAVVHITVNESILVGSVVCSLAHGNVSPDPVKFEFVAFGDNSTKELFDLSKENGFLRISMPLNYETAREHRMLVGMSFVSYPQATSFVSLVVHVKDVNEFAPQFVARNPLFWASAYTPLGSVVGRVSAFDPDSPEDSGRGISYAITQGMHSDLFIIDSNTGVISVQQPLWPTPTHVMASLMSWPLTYSIQVSADDAGGRVNHTLVKISLNPGPGAALAPLPAFQTPKLVTNVRENAPAGTIITSLNQYLEDGEYGGRMPVVFSLATDASANAGRFAVDSRSGVLATLASLDREENDLYHVVVQVAAIDGIANQLPQSIEVEIHVLDENDNTPRMPTLLLEGSVSEFAAPSTPVVNDVNFLPLVIRPDDPDLGLAGQPLFRFVGPQAGVHEELFAINPNTGILELKGRLDREAAAEHLLTLEISDMGEPLHLMSDALLRVRVRVQDVNDSPPKFLESNPTIARVMLPSYAGAEVATFSAVDPDLNDSVTYHIGSGDSQGFFQIDRNSGILRVSELLASVPSIDQRQFTLQIEARDNASTHIATHNVSVFVQASDASKMFAVEPHDGLDVNLVEHFSNNGVPLFLGQLNVRNALPGKIFSYELTNASARAFTIHAHTGEFYATGDPSASGELDREVTPVLALRVIVRDLEVSPRSQQRIGEALIRVHLEDINDHAPQFIGLPFHATFCVKETTQLLSFQGEAGRPSSHIMSRLKHACQSNHFEVTAKDEDEGANGEVTYRLISIQPPAEPPLLSIDPMSGRISLVHAVPSDWAGRRLRAIVRATDGGQRSTDALFEVDLAGRLGPRFTETHYTAVVREDVDLGHAVTTLEAYSASENTLLYRVVEVEEEGVLVRCPFVLDYKTGVVRVGSPLDYERTDFYKLLVEAMDPTTGVVARTNVYVNVTDANDESPEFFSPIYRSSISESLEVGSIIDLNPAELATDADSGANGEIRYYLQSIAGNDDDDVLGRIPRDAREGLEASTSSVPGFGVDPASGQIRLTEGLDFEEQPPIRTFWIVARDGGSPALVGRSLVEITVLDANDNPPQFERDTEWESAYDPPPRECHRTVTITDGAPTDAFVLRLTASDADVNDTIIYRLVSGSGSDDMFRVDERNKFVSWRPPQTPEAKARLASALFAYEAGQRGSGGLSFEVEASDGIHTTACEVHVDVMPSNRYPPKFTKGTLIVGVAENLPVGSTVAQLELAVDDDDGQFGSISYQLIGDTEKFTLDPKSGELTLASALDYETTDHYSLTVMASDAGGLSDFKSLEISVTDVNDNVPVIELVRYEITLSPSEYSAEAWVTFASSANQITQKAASVRLPLKIEAQDADSGPNGKVTYRLFGQQANASLPFDVDPRTGDVVLLQPLNGNQSAAINFFVQACDQPTDGKPLCSEPIGVTVYLANVEVNSKPTITCSSVAVAESTLGLKEAVAGCQIDRANQKGKWALVGVDAMRSFKIDAKTGQIYAMKELNFETLQRYRLAVQYRVPPGENALRAPLISTAHVDIDVVDVNDCSPKFWPSPIQALIVPESIAVGKRIFRMPAHDCDAEDAGLLSYGLRSKTNSHPDAQFRIDSKGWITIASPLDREETPSYNLTVTVTDSAGHSSTADLIIDLLDSNDNPPEWKGGNAAAINITENELPYGPIFTLQVADKDSSSDISLLKFYQVEQTSHQFTVSPSGRVYLRARLDAESADHHLILVKAYDGLHESVEPFKLTVFVNDVNDNPPICHAPDREISVLESTEPGVILSHFNATDSDRSAANSALSYHLLEDLKNSDLFSVNGTTGVLSLAHSLDFEQRRHHNLRVEARDTGGLACQYNLRVRVLDTNDNPPVFSEPIEISPVPENAAVGSLVGKIHATDVDSVDVNGLEYSLVAPRNTSFSVDKNSGLLRVIQPLDRETLAVHEITVVVTDGAASPTPPPQGTASSSPRHTATASVTIRLLDVNDSPPQFIDPRPQVSVSELTPVGSLVMNLEAVSHDEGDNGVVRYRLLENQPEFILNSTTGELFLTSELDYERTPRYFLTIEAKDGGHPPLSSTTVATINVIDVNDNQPHFIGQDVAASDLSRTNDNSSRGVFSFEVFENTPSGTQIGRITATDADSGENGLLVYGFCAGDEQPNVTLTYPDASRVSSQTPQGAVSKMFSVGSSQGELSLLFRPDREIASEYRFSVCVTDRSETPQTALTDVRVTIQDTNDCQPQFEHSNYEFFVQVDRSGNVVSTDSFGDLENASRSGSENILLGHLAITDLDASPNAGPFKCKLSAIKSSSPTWSNPSSVNPSVPLFSVRSNPTLPNDNGSPPLTFRGLQSNQTGFCSIYAASNLPLGTKSLVVRAHDNGMTALHSSVTITVHVSRQSDLPPEIVNSNTTLVVYRGSTVASLSTKPRFTDDGLSSTTSSTSQTTMSQGVAVAQVAVSDRTTFDQLFFELLPDPVAATHFIIDQYTGSIRVQPLPDHSTAVPPPPDVDYRIDHSVSWLKPNLPKLQPLAQLNPGLYELRVRVSNASLRSNGSIYLKVVGVTDEMLDAACVLHISDISPSELFIQHLDTSLKMELAKSLLRGPSTIDPGENIFILSAQSSSPFGRREKRSVPTGGSGVGVDLLMAVYDPVERQFIESGQLVQRIHALQTNLSKLVGHQIHAYNSLCALKKCDSGSCVTRAVLNAESPPNVFEVHGVGHVTPRFSLLSTCRCPANFGGVSCDRPRNVCATVACKSPRVCVPSPLQPGTHACVCAPPWAGNNCEVLNRPQGDPKACFSETCFTQRENGPLQFTGASYIYWQMAKPLEHRIEVAFAVNTRQLAGPLVSFKWSALRSFKIRLLNDGHIAVSPVDFMSGSADSDWLVSKGQRVSDGQWHRVRFALFASATDEYESSSLGLQWWAELVIDGANAYSMSIDWAPGDTELQELLLGADVISGFRPPADSKSAIPVEPSDPSWPSFRKSEELGVLRSGFIGCINDVKINRVKPPYQLGLTAQQAVLLGRQNFDSGGLIDTPSSVPTLQVIRIQNIDYQCSAGSTFDGSCAYAPCLNGGSCTSHHALTYSRIDRGPSGIDPSQYTCKCQSGFQGPRCEIATDLCALQPCENGASCKMVNMPHGGSSPAYRCVCPPGFSGSRCEIVPPTANATSLCSRADALATATAGSSLCLHGSRCFDAPSGPVCACPFGWRGARCEHDLDECLLATEAFASLEEGRSGGSVGAVEDVLCNPYGAHRGVCINLPGTYRCNCSLGYAGQNCQIRNLTPLEPDSNALGLTPMHGYIIASIFALVFLLAVATVVVLTCCFRRRPSSNANNFYATRNGGLGGLGHVNSASFFWDKSPHPSNASKHHLLETARMLPDGGDGGSASGLGGSIVMDPGAAVRQVMTPDVRRQSYLVDESGRLMILRPSSVVSGPGEPMQMVYLANSTAGGSASPVPTVGYVPTSSTMVRRSFIEAPFHSHRRFVGGSPVPHPAAPMTPQHLSQLHLASARQPPGRQGSINTLTSDRISLGSGSDRFSVQSGGHQQRHAVGKIPQPTTTAQPIFYVYPQTAACARRSQVVQQPSHPPPVHAVPVPQEGAIIYRPVGNSVGNLSASGRRLSLFGIPESEIHHPCGQANINGQMHPTESTKMRAAASMHLVAGARLFPSSPPTVQSQPYWAESTLSLLPTLPPTSQQSQHPQQQQQQQQQQQPQQQKPPVNHNGRPSLYRKAIHSYASNSDLQRSNRLSRQRNLLAPDGTSQTGVQRPQSVCDPPTADSTKAATAESGSGEACANGSSADLGSLRWEHQIGSSPVSAFAIAEPRGVQHPFQQHPKRSQLPSDDYHAQQQPEPKLESSISVDTLTSPCAVTTRDSTSERDSTFKPSQRGSGDGEEPTAVGKTNTLTPRPLPPNMPLMNGTADPLNQKSLKIADDNESARRPLLESNDDTPVNTLKRTTH